MNNEPLILVDIAHQQYRLAKAEYEKKRDSYRKAVAYARDEGVTYSAIARTVGTTRQKIHRMLYGE
jgi:predicted transcriptional regulator